VSDTRGRYLEVNGAACALTGYGRDELVGMSIADILAGEGAAETADRLVGLLALGPGGNEIRIRRKDGSTRHCLVHASTIDSDRLLGQILDITDRKEAESSGTARITRGLSGGFEPFSCTTAGKASTSTRRCAG
jgi:PAS domain S-box-containing protein